MRKFLEEFEDKSVEDIKTAFPEYSYLFDEVLKLENKVKGDISRQVSDEFYSLVDSLDRFLFRDENLMLLGVNMETKSVSLMNPNEAKERLEKEIEQLSQGIDTSLIDAQVKLDMEKSKKSRIDISQLVEKSRDMYDPNEQYYGLKFTQTEFKAGNFNRVLSIFQTGCKFYTGNTPDFSYVMFKLNNEDRLIIQMNNEVRKYENIFGGQKSALEVYVLSKKREKLDILYKTIRYAFEEGAMGVIDIEDKDLFNKNYLFGAYEDIFYQEADLLLQSEYILERSDTIKKSFSLHFPLQYILTISFCKAIYNIQSRENYNISDVRDEDKGLTYTQIADKIRNNIKTKTFKIEGIGDVPHSENVLDELQNLNYLDANLSPTGISESVMFYSGQGHAKGFTINQKFNASSYYIDDIKSKFKSSKNKFYSEFNGTPVFHTGDTISNISFAIVLSSKVQNDFGFKDATQKSSFPVVWQSAQNFKEYSEYVPFATSSALKFYPRTSEIGKRGLENIINFKNDERYDMYFTCIENPSHTFAFNSFEYNAILKIHSDKKTKILGPKITASQVSEPIYFMIQDDKNNLLAIIKPLGSTIKKYKDDKYDKSSKVEQMAFFESLYFSLSSKDNPAPVWDFDKLITDIKEIAPEEVEIGVILNDAGNLTNESDLEESKEKTDTSITEESEILSADDYDNPTPIYEDIEEEASLEDEIEALEEGSKYMPEDEELRDELQSKKEELLKKKSKEEPDIEPVVEVKEDKEEISDSDLDDLFSDDDLLDDEKKESDEETDYDDIFDID